MTNKPTLSEMAAYYVKELGWPIFPVSRSKVPLTPHGYRDATMLSDQIDAWSDEFPDANIAAPCGEITDIIVVDLDGDEGMASAKRLRQERYWTLPETATVRTARGEHRYYRWMPNIKNSAGQIAPGIDVRSDGGSIILPPSLHASGARYEWMKRPNEVHLPLAPLWLVRGRREPKAPPQRDADIGQYVAEVRSAPEGQRNHTLNRSAYICALFVADGRVQERDAKERLTAAALHAGLHRLEVTRTIESAFRSARPPAQGR